LTITKKEVHKMIKIATSLLAADVTELGKQTEMVRLAGAQYLHLDIMDGHFVPNLSFGPSVVSGLRKVSDLVFDVHLMLSRPDKYIDAFAKAGADIITVHVESESNVKECIDKIHSHGIKAGIVFNPDTEIEPYAEYLNYVEMALVMSVYPGFGGQKFIERVLPKVTLIRQIKGSDFDIEIDGGINAENAAQAKKAGANVLVAGSAIFGAKDPAAVIKAMSEK